MKRSPSKIINKLSRNFDNGYVWTAANPKKENFSTFRYIFFFFSPAFFSLHSGHLFLFICPEIVVSYFVLPGCASSPLRPINRITLAPGKSVSCLEHWLFDWINVFHFASAVYSVMAGLIFFRLCFFFFLLSLFLLRVMWLASKVTALTFYHLERRTGGKRDEIKKREKKMNR